MAATDNTVTLEHGDPSKEVVRTQLTGATSTFVSKFGTVVAFQLTVEGTNATTATRSGSTITITGTDDDYVNLTIYGVG